MTTLSERGPCWISTELPTSLPASLLSRSHTNSQLQSRNETQIKTSIELTLIENVCSHFGSPPLVPHWHSVCSRDSWCHIGSAAALAPGGRGSCQAANLTFGRRSSDSEMVFNQKSVAFRSAETCVQPTSERTLFEPSQTSVYVDIGSNVFISVF